MTTSLEQKLEANRALQRTLVEKRDYGAAQRAMAEATLTTQSARVVEEQEHTRQHAIEHRRLQIARQIAFRKVHQDVTDELREIEHRWEEKKLRQKELQDQRLETFKELTMRHAKNRPVVLSAYVRQLQGSEAKLADMQMYAEAEQVRRRIQHKEEEEKIDAEEKHLQHARKTIERRKAIQEENSRFFLIKMKNEIALAKFRAAEEEKRLHLLFDHVERDLEHSHKIRGTSKPEVLAAVKTATNAENRGTYYFHRVHGNRFDVPSLCDLYGDRLSPNKRNASPPRKPTTAM